VFTAKIKGTRRFSPSGFRLLIPCYVFIRITIKSGLLKTIKSGLLKNIAWDQKLFTQKYSMGSKAVYSKI
jgi:hypothetical protein